MARVAINGLGRIGRAILKLAVDEPALELAAVNEEPPSAFSIAELCVDGNALDRSKKGSA